MVERTTIELRTYLKARRKSSEWNVIPEFDNFLHSVGILFRLRVAAEDNFKLNPHLAKSKTGALPLEWCQINDIINPPSDAPGETLVSQIAKECFSETEELLRDMRKVLVRERGKVALGQVQQVDPHCLRWLTRQPGRNTLEKAGPRQQILAIVRNENFNTLENRVLKDFLSRTSILALDYLKENESKFKEHQNVKIVKRMVMLCEKGLAMPIMESIGDLFGLPVPNYVLRQERRYSKIWKSYCLIVKQADITERLWKKRAETNQTLDRLKSGIPLHTSPYAKYESSIWFNLLDGEKPILDLPFWENELAQSPRVVERPDTNDVVVIDLAVPDQHYDLLIYGRHANAKPYLQNFKTPSIEDIEGEHWFLEEILSKKDSKRLQDYFEQLKSVLGGERWIILVPDDWDALWQESIITAAPFPRDNVFLLWRSVAAVIGFENVFRNACENDSVAVVDLQQDGKIAVSKLLLAKDDISGGLVPQRKSYSRHPERFRIFKDSEKVPSFTLRERVLEGKRSRANHSVIFSDALKCVEDIRHIIFLGDIDQGMRDSIQIRESHQHAYIGERKNSVESGVATFREKMKKCLVVYFDELEALSLVVQTKDECVVAKELVKADEKFPGGTEYRGASISDLILRRGESKITFYLHEGVPENNTPLQEYSHEFSIPIDLDAELQIDPRMTPGQGLALIYISAPFLRHALKVDLRNDLKDSDKTISIIQSTMKRRFPPDLPMVVASPYIWEEIKPYVVDYLQNRIPQLVAGTFAHAQEYYGEINPRSRPFPPVRHFNEATDSPIDRLKRENVFGNAPDHRYPCDDQDCDFQLLFKRLANDYNDRKNVVRLIAWTYQYDNKTFDPIKSALIDKYEVYREMEGACLKHEEYTLCANLIDNQEQLERLFKAAAYRIINKRSNEDDLRLVYNLLQFHPNTIERVSTEKCEDLMQALEPLYKKAYAMKSGMERTKHIGYALKPMLFLLHRRRYDRGFFTQPIEWNPDWIQRPLSNKWDETRVAFIEYVNGRGTLEGIPGS